MLLRYQPFLVKVVHVLKISQRNAVLLTSVADVYSFQGLQKLIVRNLDFLNVLSSTDISIDKLFNLPFQALSASR